MRNSVTPLSSLPIPVQSYRQSRPIQSLYIPHQPEVPPSPESYSPLPQKTPITPSSPGPIPIKGDSDFHSGRPMSHAEEPYSPRSIRSPTTPLRPVFSPDAATGPNGLNPELHQPGQIVHPNMDLSAPGADHEWKHSLCDCGSDVGTCMTGLFCPCVIYGKAAYRLSQRTDKKDPTDMLGYSATNTQCGLMAAACGLWCLFPLIQRTRLRHLYKLSGSIGSDICKACYCCCCVVIQNEREIRDREESARRWAGPAGTEAYSSPGQMVYAPPPRG
ncbi:PLAC8-domain-containing protein [Lepidopterella palustris CBS 459.81]|uniref:PLAC8-domain-containing protein n=1 Tax=Lepidopterella palustris CBS 459.81 TaxID=1314670 RepID=A0A8E2E7G8_9PEZI|nr:PLAC8-domain-containing protein [Lepidopterella palustris CBS 459.81]